MGYSLVFYSLDWNTLCKDLMYPRHEQLENIRSSQWEQLCSERTPEEVEAAWRRARSELSRSLTPGILRPVPPISLGADAALLFVAQVQHLGHNLGELDHASASGEAFLRGFLDGVAATFFRAPQLMEWLTDRPICELRSEMLPSWGGLHQSELIQMRPGYNRESQQLPEVSEDDSIWLEEMVLILQDAASLHRDVVTLYV